MIKHVQLLGGVGDQKPIDAPVGQVKLSVLNYVYKTRREMNKPKGAGCCSFNWSLQHRHLISTRRNRQLCSDPRDRISSHLCNEGDFLEAYCDTPCFLSKIAGCCVDQLNSQAIATMPRASEVYISLRNARICVCRSQGW